MLVSPQGLWGQCLQLRRARRPHRHGGEESLAEGVGRYGLYLEFSKAGPSKRGKQLTIFGLCLV